MWTFPLYGRNKRATGPRQSIINNILLTPKRYFFTHTNMARLKTTGPRPVSPITSAHGITDHSGGAVNGKATRQMDKERRRFEALKARKQAAKRLAEAIARKVYHLDRTRGFSDLTPTENLTEQIKSALFGVKGPPLRKRTIATLRNGRTNNVNVLVQTPFIEAFFKELSDTSESGSFRADVKLDLDEPAVLRLAAETLNKPPSEVHSRYYRGGRVVHINLCAPLNSGNSKAKHVLRGGRFMSKSYSFCYLPTNAASEC